MRSMHNDFFLRSLGGLAEAPEAAIGTDQEIRFSRIFDDVRS